MRCYGRTKQLHQVCSCFSCRGLNEGTKELRKRARRLSQEEINGAVAEMMEIRQEHQQELQQMWDVQDRGVSQ